MNLIRSISNCKILVVFFLLLPQYAISQSDTLNLSAVTGTYEIIDDSSRHSLYTGAGYGSNMVYMGSTISGNQPFGYAALTYGFNSRFYATVSTVHLSDIKPYLSFYTGSLNYNHVFNSWFDMAASISGYKFTSGLADTLISDFIYSDITLGIDWRLIYSKISFGGLLSVENSTYFQVKNSRYFQTPEFADGKVYISFDPYINLLFGTLIKSETGNEATVTSPRPFGRWNPIGQSSPATTYYQTFGLIEIDFGLPVAINFDRLTIEAEPSFILPIYHDSDFPGPKGFVFLLSGYFRIF